MPGEICYLEGTLDSVGITTQQGKLTLSNDVPISTVDDTSNPILLLPFVDEWYIIDGNLSNTKKADLTTAKLLSARETETVRVSVRWDFYPRIDGGSPTSPVGAEYDSKPSYTLFSIIPDTTSYNFASLADTGFTNDTITTGALVVAREMLTNPVLLSLITDRLGDYRQSDNPSPTLSGLDNNNAEWIDTDNYDRFLASTLYSKWFKQPQRLVLNVLSQGTSSQLVIPTPSDPNYHKFIITDIVLEYFVGSVNNSTNYWTFQFGYRTWNGIGFTQFATPFNTTVSTQSQSVATKYKTTIKPGLNVSPIIDTDTVSSLILNASRVGVPSTLDLKCSMGISYFYE